MGPMGKHKTVHISSGCMAHNKSEFVNIILGVLRTLDYVLGFTPFLKKQIRVHKSRK
jgi:hypothetical protein